MYGDVHPLMKPELKAEIDKWLENSSLLNHTIHYNRLSQVDQWVQRYPYYNKVHLLYGFTLYHTAIHDIKLRRAAKHLKHYISVTSQNTFHLRNAHFYLMAIYIRLKEYQLADSHTEQLIQLLLDAKNQKQESLATLTEAFFFKGRVLKDHPHSLSSGQKYFFKSINHYLQSKFPPYIYHMLYGELLYWLGKYKPAIKNLKKSILLDEKQIESHFLLAKIYYKIGQYKEAKKHIDPVLYRYHPNSSIEFHLLAMRSLLKAEMHFLAGLINEKLNSNPQKSKGTFHDSLFKKAPSKSWHKHLTLWHHKPSPYKIALDTLLEKRSIHTHTTKFYFLLAQIYYQMGQYDEAQHYQNLSQNIYEKTRYIPNVNGFPWHNTLPKNHFQLRLFLKDITEKDLFDLSLKIKSKKIHPTKKHNIKNLIQFKRKQNQAIGSQINTQATSLESWSKSSCKPIFNL